MNKKNIDDNDKIFLWLYAYFKKLSSSKKLCLTFFLPAFIIYIFLNKHTQKVRHGNCVCVWGVCEFFSNRNTLISLSISAKENMMLLLYLEWGVNKRWTSAWFDVRFEGSSEEKKVVFPHDAFLTCEIFVRSLNFFLKWNRNLIYVYLINLIPHTYRQHWDKGNLLLLFPFSGIIPYTRNRQM